ncbi:thrombospondin-2-like [Mercenaria mercenaria]|uniref:thrombospondin-2-like n=1 Tax=Mercenaria mercenaria TaxID=6596 RepID=UPI00234EFAD2|nr:thrombospondin-2-like [Mercenaria mercenaria]
MDVIYILIYLTLVGSQSVEALECFDCADIDDIDDCLNTTHCSVGQSCYQDLKQTENSPRYTLGCTDNQVCGHLSNEFVGRDLTERQTQDCHECCSTANCNKHLCEHLKPSACIDDVNADCAWLNTIVNICEDIQHAKTVCAKFCGLCHLVDGNWADWSPWSTCDVTCQNGTQTRTRTCTNPAPAYGGLDCVGNSTDFKICYTGKLCPVHGGWSGWGQWESCPVTCGTGIETRHRSCSNPYPDRVGDHCFGEGMDVRLCMPGPCANGGWSGWGTWSSCSLTCGGGLKSRSRNCTNPRPSLAGRPCYGDPSHVTSCNSNPCPTPSVSFRSKGLN